MNSSFCARARQHHRFSALKRGTVLSSSFQFSLQDYQLSWRSIEMKTLTKPGCGTQLGRSETTHHACKLMHSAPIATRSRGRQRTQTVSFIKPQESAEELQVCSGMIATLSLC